MLLTTTENIPGKNYEILGLVTGSSIMCKNIGRDIGASFKNLVGGQMEAYTELMVEAKNNATNYMMGQAQQMGADAIVAVHYMSPDIVQGGAEIMAYGTAVKFI